MSELAPGQTVLDGRFRVVRRLASGGMGDVYAAEQVSLGRTVALKVLRDELRAAPGMEERFRREAQILSGIDHPNVVRVIDFGQAPEAAFLVMELVEGETLEDQLARGRPPFPDALSILRQLADGLAAIHARSVVHRDVKPENVVLTHGESGVRARLLDFGIARMIEPDPTAKGLTQVGLVLGTPEYVSPEQAMGQSLDARTDIYSFGVVAFRLLTGRRLFPGPGPTEFLSQHLTQSPPRLSSVAPELAAHAELEDLIARCLDKERDGRPASGAELARQLKRITEQPVGTTAPVTPAPGHAAARMPSPSQTQTSTTTGAPGATGPAQPSPPSPVKGTGAAALAPDGAGQRTGQQVELARAAAPSSTDQPEPARTGTALFGVAPPEKAPASSSPSTWTLTGASATTAIGKAQNLTLMLTDIKGFTARTSRQSLQENARMLEEHDALLLPILREFRGRLVQKRGDALFAVFRSPTDAVKCGMAMQDALWRRNQLAPAENALDVRVALHLGEVLVLPEGVVGEPANVIAQVEGEADGGEVMLTEAVRLSMNRAGIELEPRGALSLVGGGSLRLYRCKPAAEGPPFGGVHAPPPAATLEGLKAAQWPILRDRLLKLRKGVVDVAWHLRARVRNATREQKIGLAAFALVPVVIAAAWLVSALSTTSRIERLIDGGDTKAALDLIASLDAESQKSPDIRNLKATALHLSKRHEEELAALEGLEAARVAPEVLRAIAEDYGRTGAPSARNVLRRLHAEHESFLVSLAEGEPTMAQWGALRFLDREGKAKSLDLPDAYEESLKNESCAVRGQAAARLAELKATDAIDALEEVVASPRRSAGGIFDDGDCGHEQAQAAIKKLRAGAKE